MSAPKYFPTLQSWSDYWGKEGTRQPSTDEILSANSKARREGRPYPYSKADIWGRG